MLIPRKDNFGYRISSFKSIPECENAFVLSQEWEFEQTDAMRDGKLFESYVFGFKDEATQAKMEGRKKEATLKQIKDKAEQIKKYLKGGYSWERLSTTVNGKTVSGEPDYVGDVIVDGELISALVDLKNTKDIFKIWDGLSSRFDYFQSIGYNWLRWRNNLDILPFVYFVNENSGDDEIIRPIVVEITMDDIFWCESLIEKYTADFLPDYNPERCKGRTYSEGRCKFCSKCPYGIGLLTDLVRIKFSDLDDPLKIQVNQAKQFSQVNNKKPKEFNPSNPLSGDSVEESDIDKLIMKELTYLIEEFSRKSVVGCRSCREKTILIDSKECTNCGVKIKVVEG